MDGQSYGIQWIQHDMKTAGQMIIDAQPPHEEDILANSGDTDDGVQYLVDDDEDDGNVHEGATTADIDQIAAENLIFMARDGQMVTEIIGTDENGTVVVSASDGTTIDCETVMQQAEEMSSNDMTQQHEDTGGGGCDYTEEYTETTPQMVTEEVITDDWVQHQGEERVEIPAEQIMGSRSQILLDIEVPLPTMQDEYTALRPYPCDFCSRRFRKKASLNNHMVAHQHDRPNLCKLCGSRFFRRGDLINHLKAHAEAPEVDAEYISFAEREHHQQRHHQVNDHYYDQDWSVNTDAIAGGYHQPSKSSRKSHNVSGNSSSTSTSTTVARRGRISRLRPKEENYTINESLAQSHSQQQQQCEQYANVASDMEYVEECQELQASTAAVKLTQDHSPAHQRHYPIIDDSKPFVCQQCGLAFAREKALLSHAKNHRIDSPHECNQCNEMFWDTATLQEHQKTHHFEESNSEYDPEEAEDTQSESESERLYGEFYCSECGMSFHRQDVLRRHARAHHKTTVADEATTVGNVEVDNTRDQHCCNTCGETFAEALDLLAHAEIHARYPPFKCVLCGETFFEEHTIKRHLQSQHGGEMTQNSCILCGKECRDRKALIKHAWDHSREKCHSCSKCGKNFHNKARLKRHMASHRDKSVICDVCHEEFPDGRTLSNHRHSHSATASGKLFPCHECGKTFGSRSSQQIHVRIHTGERPYGCRFCWKAFADGGTLRKHERIHTGEKPYACAVCPRAFNQRVVLREHIRSHHSGLDAKRGTYFCTVCTADLSSSNDLIQHLIQHSDMNTAMQRQPVTGPRKYKRRRKLKPHEIARLRSEGHQNGSDIDISDFDMDTVDDLLGIAVTTTNTNSTINGKSNKKNGGAAAASSANNNNNNNSGKRSTEEDEDNEDDDDDDEVDVGTGGSKKARYNSASSNSDKLWQTKLINSNDETYKSMLSNLENTLQSIDTLVVSSNAGKTIIEDRKFRHKTNNNNSNNNDNLTDSSSTAQRTQQVQIIKMETKYATDAAIAATTTTKTRRKPEKSPKLTRPRMIHTEKSRIASSDGSRKRSKTYITRTEPANIELLPKSSSTTMVDDYEIISPDTKPPNQISSSPLHIKQENEQHQQQQLHHHSHTLSSRNGDLYDAQLLLEASTLRKATYEKFNPSIVNDLEEILRSPIKSDRGERLRFTSESSSQFLVEPAEEDQHLIKIEPTSPDLREIVAGNSAGSSSINNSNTAERRSTRSTRSRLVTANRKYLEFETDITSNNMKINATSTAHQQQQKASTNKSKAARNQRKDNAATSPKTALSSSLSSPSKSYLNDAHAPVSPSSAFASISAVVSAADANAAATAAAAAAAGAVSTQPERKQRYFECEMCSAIFPDRAQLLDHVPIHI